MTEQGTERASPFGTWTGRDPFPIFPNVSLLSVGGDQVLLCRVTYAPGTTVKLHSHEHTEQLMAIVDGSVDVTIAGEQQTMVAGDVCVINRGVEHEVYSENGVTFFEALAPVPLDHVEDPERDLVLGPDGGKGHVER
ncbi:MAG TPA: cupin domain-containing protein [Gaiellaceae bacterium]|nr:cupin domain-containing protein [Gaiellaceae bacterium]